MEFVETQILPKYTEFGESHGLRHVNRVIKNSLELARITGADINMVYIIAAYHDLVLPRPDKDHERGGGRPQGLVKPSAQKHLRQNRG